MRETSSRRDFLRVCGLGTVGAAMSTAVPGVLSAIEPIRRTPGPKFKFSLAAYSYRGLLQGKNASLTVLDFIEDCARMGLDGVELTSYYLPKVPTSDDLTRLRQAAFLRGMDISGTAVGNDFCHPPGEKRDEQIRHVKNWIEYSARLTAPVIRIFAGSLKSGQSLQDAQALVISAIEECCEHAGKYGVMLALENHGGITAQAEDMLTVVKAIKSPWFGVNFDSGNFHGEDVYGELAKIAPYAVNAQVKVVVQPAGRPKEPADFARLAKMLREAGYRGYVVLEYEEAEDPRTMCPKFLDELRKAFA